MSGVYGDQLSAFPELLSMYELFTMPAKAGGGFERRTVYRRTRGYLTRRLGGVAGAPDDTFSEFGRAEFYAREAVPANMIRQGVYVEDVDGTMYKFMQSDMFVKEGSFTVHRLFSVEGPTDQQVPLTQVEDNILDSF